MRFSRVRDIEIGIKVRHILVLEKLNLIKIYFTAHMCYLSTGFVTLFKEQFNVVLRANIFFQLFFTADVSEISS